jgi:type VI secretion system protein ImpB
MAVNDEIPKSRITLTYRTDVNGEPVDTTLPFRLLLMGDFSEGTSVDHKKDLDQRQIRNLDGKNLNKVMEDMKMTLQLKDVPNKIDPDDAGSIDVTLKIDSMKSFTPVEIAKQIPKVRALLLLRKLLLEVQANLDNSKDFRVKVRELAKDKTQVAELQNHFAGLDTFRQGDSVKLFEIPKKKLEEKRLAEQNKKQLASSNTPATPVTPPTPATT